MKRVSAPRGGRKKAVKSVKRKPVPREIREARALKITVSDAVLSGPLWNVYASQWDFGIGCYSEPWEKWTPGYWNDLQDEYGVSDRIRRRYEAVFKVLKAKVERLNRKAASKK